MEVETFISDWEGDEYLIDRNHGSALEVLIVARTQKDALKTIEHDIKEWNESL